MLYDLSDRKMFSKSTILLLSLVVLSIQDPVYISRVMLELNKLRDIVNTIVIEAFTKYRDLAEELDYLAIDIRTNGSQVIETCFEDYLQRYENTKNIALETGVDITTCLNSVGNQLQNLPSENINGLIACISTEVDMATGYIRQGSVAELEYDLELVLDGERRMTHCGTSSGACLEDVLTELSMLVDSTRPYREWEIDWQVRRLKSSQKRIENMCGERFTSIARDKGRQVISEFENCVNGRIGSG